MVFWVNSRKKTTYLTVIAVKQRRSHICVQYSLFCMKYIGKTLLSSQNFDLKNELLKY